MAEDNEAKARAVLAEMQLRLSQGPYIALGVDERISAEGVRSAFLALTKQFHPARFGRMSPELQRLSNEVFLGIKQAHEALTKALGSSGRVPLRPHGFGEVSHAQADGTNRTLIPRAGDRHSVPSGTTPPPTTGTARDGSRRYSTPPHGIPVQSRTATGQLPMQRQTGPLSLPNGLSGHHTTSDASRTQPLAIARTQTPPSVARTQTPPSLARPQAPTTGRTPTQPTTGRTPTQPTTGRTPTPSPGNRTTTPATGRPVTSPRTANASGSLPRTAVHGTGAIPRPPHASPPSATNFHVPTVRGVAPTGSPPHGGAPGSGGRPVSPPPPSATFNAATVRGLTPAQTTQPLARVAPTEFDEQAALREALALLDAGNWAAARQAMHALAAKVPQSKHYRALLCCARGREAHAAGRSSDALAEYQRALQLDPALAQAKQAVAELQRRR